MHVQLLLFAAHREIVGERVLGLEVPEGTTPLDVYCRLQERYHDLEALRPSTTFAVNREVVEPDRCLREGDEVAFLLPVSGGAR